MTFKFLHSQDFTRCVLVVVISVRIFRRFIARTGDWVRGHPLPSNKRKEMTKSLNYFVCFSHPSEPQHASYELILFAKYLSLGHSCLKVVTAKSCISLATKMVYDVVPSIWSSDGKWLHPIGLQGGKSSGSLDHKPFLPQVMVLLASDKTDP